LIRDSQNIPTVAITLPAISSGRAPIRFTSWDATPDPTMTVAIIGR
jgi:hypothetical protein